MNSSRLIPLVPFAVLVGLALVGPLQAADQTTTGTATATAPSSTWLAFEVPFSGDADRDGWTVVELGLAPGGPFTLTTPRKIPGPPEWRAETFRGLTADTDYYLQVTFVDPDGVTGTNPQIVGPIHTLASAPNAVTLGTVTAVARETEIYVSAPIADDGNGNSYGTVELATDPGGPWTERCGSPSENRLPYQPKRCRLRSLIPGTDYWVRIQFVDPDGVTGTNPQILGPVTYTGRRNLAAGRPITADPGWGCCPNPAQLLDGRIQYRFWPYGFAWTGGTNGWGGGPPGWKQATIDLGAPTTFDRVEVWLQGSDSLPIDWRVETSDDGASWTEVFSTTDPQCRGASEPLELGWGYPACSQQADFPPATARYVRYRFDDRTLFGGLHGWASELEVFGLPAECIDNDGDGYGLPGDASCPGGAAEDCDDADPSRYPGNPEVCNGIDDDCSNVVDDGGDALCTDSVACDGAETCAGVEGCQPGLPINCSALTDECNIGVCTEPAGDCIAEPGPPGTPCSDGDACTERDACFDGSCEPGAPLNCDDRNECTEDRCVPEFGCENPPVPPGTPCSDGDACTERDACFDGSCEPGAPLNCDDRNECTEDRCVPEFGCENPPVPPGTPCSDGDACTERDACFDGSCEPGAPLNCDDRNECTEDRCVPEFGCENPPVPPGTPCSDGDACTERDSCFDGSCAPGTPVNCSDDNDCTTDGCVPVTGCVNTAEPPGTPCEDGDACTERDACFDGSCQPGSPVDCNDDNSCTADGCVPVTGCVNTAEPPGTPCSPGSTCEDTGSEYGGGICAVTTFTCDGAEACTGTPETWEDTCGGDADNPSVTWYRCSGDNTACESNETNETDSCSDTGTELGGGSCSATDWDCDADTAMLVSTSSAGDDACGGDDDDPSVTFYICTASDGSNGDTCIPDSTNRSDSCADDGTELGGGSCSATDWDCDGSSLVSTTSSGSDFCESTDPDDPILKFFSCDAGDGAAADTCTLDSTTRSDNCSDTGSDLGGGSCAATDWDCDADTAMLVSTSSAGDDACGGDDDDPSVTFYICTASDGSNGDTCIPDSTNRSDSCADDGTELGGGSCSATDWDCDGSSLVSTTSSGSDFCESTDPDDPILKFFSCDAGDGAAADTCTLDSTTRSDSCSDTGSDLGGGSCAATDWDCDADTAMLVSTSSAGDDSCADDPVNGAITTFFVCNSSDGVRGDSCAADATDCGDALDETCRDGLCGDPATSCVPVDRAAGELCRDGDMTDTACTDPDVCDGDGTCVFNNQPCALVTSSSLCPFDVDPNRGACVDDVTGERTGEDCDPDGDPGCAVGTCVPTNEFRLIFTPDVKNWVAYKHNASNPGQYYYNLVYNGEPRTTETLSISVPYPFVTQGAMPLHVYDGMLVDTGDLADGQEDCLLPPQTAIATSDLDISLDDYRDSTTDGGFLLNALVDCHYLRCSGPGSGGANGQSLRSECVITLDVPIPESGQVYVNLHLDWGLKGGKVDINPCDDAPDRYDLGTEDLAFGGWDALYNTDTDTGDVAIANSNDWEFSHTDDSPDGNLADSVRNINMFKRVKGVMGNAFHSVSGEAVAVGTPVRLTEDETGELVDFGVTDEDGYFALPYKHRGRQALYKLTLLGGHGLSQRFWLKANGTAAVDFDVDTGETRCDTTASGGCQDSVAVPRPPVRKPRTSTEEDDGRRDMARQ